MTVDWNTFRPNLSKVLEDVESNRHAVDRAIAEKLLAQRMQGDTAPWVVLGLRRYGPARGVIVAYMGADDVSKVTVYPTTTVESDSVIPDPIEATVPAKAIIPLSIHASEKGPVVLRISWTELGIGSGVYQDVEIPDTDVVPGE